VSFFGDSLPAGTGFECYRQVRIPGGRAAADAAAERRELELEGDMEYFVEPEEALGTRGETIDNESGNWVIS
jgi:hypothetical protein